MAKYIGGEARSAVTTGTTCKCVIAVRTSTLARPCVRPPDGYVPWLLKPFGYLATATGKSVSPLLDCLAKLFKTLKYE